MLKVDCTAVGTGSRLGVLLLPGLRDLPGSGPSVACRLVSHAPSWRLEDGAGSGAKADWLQLSIKAKQFGSAKCCVRGVRVDEVS